MLSAAPRISLAAGTLPPALRPLVWSDLLEFYTQLLSGGRMPYWDTVFYYPPVVGYIAGILARLTGDAYGYLVGWALIVAAVAGGVALALARTVGTRRALLWAAAPQLLLYAGLNFDVLPTSTVVAAVLLARARRSTAAVAALAIGTLLKAFPLAVAPLEIDRLRGDPRRAAVAAAAFIGIGVALALPSLLAPWPFSIFVGEYARRENFDSLWGLLEGISSGRGSSSALMTILTTLGLLGTYVFGVVPAARRAGSPVIGAGLAVVTVLIWTRLYSPQYSVWVLPFFALTTVPVRWYLMLAAADIAVFLSVFPLSLVPRDPGDPIGTVLIGVMAAGVALREVALVGTWLALRRLALSAVRSSGEERREQLSAI